MPHPDGDLPEAKSIARLKTYCSQTTEYWQHTQLIIDVVPGRGSGFSVEAPEGVRFLTRSRVFTDDEVTELETAGPPSRAA